ncbi:hypothetical protein DC498_14060 [Terrimonas sp.]|nr:hypothetical protein DC498_14060 [Terrimonas sp.]
MIYSLLACCKLNEAEPMSWLTHILKKFRKSINDIENLLPQKP